MSQRLPYPRQEAVVGIGIGIILSIVTCGIYGLFWQYKQIEVLNAWLGRKEYDFWTWLLLSIITCGIFSLYYEYTRTTPRSTSTRSRRTMASASTTTWRSCVFSLRSSASASLPSRSNRVRSTSSTVRLATFNHRLLATTFLVGLGVVAAWSSLSGVAPGDVTFVPCPVHAVTGIPCPGCGMTRACAAAVRGEFRAAWSFHPFAFLLIPLAVSVAACPARTRRAWASVPRGLRGFTTGAAVASCIGLWLSRIL